MTWRGNPVRPLVPLIGGFVLLLLTVAFAVFLSTKRQESAKYARRALDAVTQLNRIELLAADAETGQRGYLLTGRLDYLEPYNVARRELMPSLDRLATIVSSDPQQAARLDTLRRAIDRKLAELKATIDLRASEKTEQAIAYVKNDSGQTLMTAIRATIDEMLRTESATLDRRRTAAVALAWTGQSVLIGSVFLVLLFGVFAVFDARRRVLALEATNQELEREATERRAAEDKVRQLQKLEAVGQLTGGIAHDFNNMLSIVLGFLDLARRRLDPATGAAALKCIDSATDGANRAVTLTKRMLAFSRQQPLEPRVVDANALIGGMSDLIRRAIGETIIVESVLSGGLWKTFVDAAQVENVLVNLAVNARDAMPDGGKLTIETGNADLDDRYAANHNEVTAGQYVLISVSDTGVGMSAAVIDRAFDPFYTTKEVGKGTGLGLSQVYGFIKQSGGHVKIYSELRQGTTVKVYLPRYRGPAPTKPNIEKVEAPTGGRAQEVILVVEDETKVRLMTVESLRELGYTVVHAGLPSEALDKLDARPDITMLLTDIVMPEMSGRQLAERALAGRPDLKVLYTTGYTRNAIVHNGIVDAGTAFLPKPFTLSQLSAKIRQTLDG